MREAGRRLEVPVEHKRIKVRTVGPYDSPQPLVHADLREEVRVSQRLENGAAQLSGEVNIARAAGAEAKPQAIVAQDLYGGDAYKVHRFILRQWLDRIWRSAALRSLPIGFQLVAVEARPLLHMAAIRMVCK